MFKALRHEDEKDLVPTFKELSLVKMIKLSFKKITEWITVLVI